jgi:hypothetical protein
MRNRSLTNSLAADDRWMAAPPPPCRTNTPNIAAATRAAQIGTRVRVHGGELTTEAHGDGSSHLAVDIARAA